MIYVCGFLQDKGVLYRAFAGRNLPPLVLCLRRVASREVYALLTWPRITFENYLTTASNASTRFPHSRMAFQPSLIYVRSQHLFFQFCSLSVSDLLRHNTCAPCNCAASVPRSFSPFVVEGYVSYEANATLCSRLFGGRSFVSNCSQWY